MKREPVEIVGGGLAGLAAGVGLARRGVSVMIWESGRSPRHRVCGEFLRGIRSEIWEGLGLWPPLESVRSTVRWWVGHRMVAAWTLDQEAVAWSRPELEVRLREELQKRRGVVLEQSRREAEPKVGRILATGRRVDPSSPWFALKCHLKGVPLEADLEMHVGSSGYLGLTRVGKEMVNASGLFRSEEGVKPGTGNPPERLAGLLANVGLEKVAERVMGAEDWEDGSMVGAAGIRFGWSDLPRDACAIGDARVFIPPFTGRGMAMALESAAMAVEAVDQVWRSDGGWSSAMEALYRRLRRRFSRPVWLARAVQEALLSAPWQPWVSKGARRGWLPVRSMAGWLT